MTLVNDPLYSRDAVSQYGDTAPRKKEKRERKKFNAMATVADNSCDMSYDKSMCVVPITVQYGNSGKVLETHALLDSCSQGNFTLETLINNLGVKG